MAKSRAKFKHQVLNHGYMLPDYFQGCGVACTDWTHVATGIGSSAKEAYEDALDQLCQDPELDDANIGSWMPKSPHGVRADQVVPAEYAGDEDSEGSVWFVSVRIQYPMKKRAR